MNAQTTNTRLVSLFAVTVLSGCALLTFAYAYRRRNRSASVHASIVTKPSSIPSGPLKKTKPCRNIWIPSYPTKGWTPYCLGTILCVHKEKQNNVHDIVYLYNTADKYDTYHIKYLCCLPSIQFSVQNLRFTTGKFDTLFEDIVSDPDTYSAFKQQIFDTYESGKFQRLTLRCSITLKHAFARQWFDKFIAEHNYLKDFLYLQLETEKWRDNFCNKSCLYPKWSQFKTTNDLNDSVARKNHFDKYFKLARGFACTSKQEIIEAYDFFVTKYGITDVVVKDVGGMTGSGINFIGNKKDLIEKCTFPDKKSFWDMDANMVNIEENLTKTVGEDCEWIATHYEAVNDELIVYGPTMQILDGVAFNHRFIHYRNIDTGYASLLNDKVHAFLRDDLKPNGCGGFDFYVNKKDPLKEIYMIDVNTCRPTGSLNVLRFVEQNPDLKGQYCGELAKYFYPDEAMGRIDVQKICKELDAKGVLFNGSNTQNSHKRGVLLVMLSHYNNKMKFWMIGNDSDDLAQMRKVTDELFVNSSAEMWERFLRPQL